jgi:glycosyltransferase involved in cell wall biosynthesis
MLCNLTSDLACYLRDGDNALIVGDLSVEAVCAAIDRALALEEEQALKMRRAARSTAAEFDGSRYAEAYRSLLAWS